MNEIETIEEITFELHSKICSKLFSCSRKDDGPISFGKDVFIFNGKNKLCWFGEYQPNNKYLLLKNMGTLQKNSTVDYIEVFIELAEIKTNVNISLLNDDLSQYDIEFIDYNKYENYIIHIDCYNKINLTEDYTKNNLIKIESVNNSFGYFK
jgi:hypothetical protein